MRTSFKNHAEVCHIWAQQSQAEGKASRIFFDGPSIYSYGRHFEMGRFITKDIVFLTSQGYSVSTEKHKRYARNAVSHKRTFTVPSMFNHAENVEYYMNEIEATLKKIPKSRTRTMLRISDFHAFMAQLENYKATFKREIPKELYKKCASFIKIQDKLDYSETLKKCIERAAIREEQNQIKHEAMRQARLKDETEKINEWREGSYHGTLYAVPIMLRQTLDNSIQTSHGARVEINEALALYDKIKSGTPVHGLSIGGYTVTGFDGNTLTVGCHKISMQEMERMAGLLNKTEVK